MNGVIIGRFMPPHNGHRYLIDFATGTVDTLYVLVCTLPHEPIPGPLRYQWVQDLAPTARVIHITEAIPAARRGEQGATKIWARAIKNAVAEPIETVFASEEYGWELANHLHATYIPVDPNRRNIPISATEVRADPWGTWDFLPDGVRRWYLRHIAVIGDPVRAERLATALKTVLIRDYTAFYHSVWDTRPNASARKLPHAVMERARAATQEAMYAHARAFVVHDVPDHHALSRLPRLDYVLPAEETSRETILTALRATLPSQKSSDA